MLQAYDSIEINSLKQVVQQAVSDTKGDKTMGTIAEKIEEKGRQEGRQEKTNELALKMLEENVETAFITKVTGLTATDIEHLKQR